MDNHLLVNERLSQLRLLGQCSWSAATASRRPHVRLAGFTLIELLVVIAIIAILGGMAHIFLGKSLHTEALKLTTSPLPPRLRCVSWTTTVRHRRKGFPSSKSKLTLLVVLLLASHTAFSHDIATGIAFPGREPGKAVAESKDKTLSLENDVIATTWDVRDGGIFPALLINKLTGQRFDQQGAELFCLSTKPAGDGDGSIAISIRLGAERVVVYAGKDGYTLVEVASFPRAVFPGEPKLVRVGTMNLKAQARDHNGPAGAIGESRIFEIRPASTPPNKDHFEFKTPANRAMTSEFPFPAGAKRIAARIDKGTDTGLSWSPALALVWEDGTRFLLVGVRDKSGVLNVTTSAGEQTKGVKSGAFPLGDLKATAFKLVGTPRIVKAAMTANTSRLSDNIPGVALEAALVSPGGIRATWRAELRDGSSYFRQTVELASPEKNIALHGVGLADVRVTGARTVGTALGCPVAGSGFFFGVEMPGAQNLVDDEGAQIGFACSLELAPGQPVRFGAVTGVAPEGQLRRAFLCYIERERARASRPFLHYNCWYDLGYKVDQEKLLDVVARFDAELVKKRGVPVRAFLVDDGWDDPAKGLWVENARTFPKGFAGMKEAFDKFGTHLGIWISPLGGYGGDKERNALARRMELIPEDAKMDLSFPRYRQWFEQRCLQLMREGGVNIFKWDRAGNGASPHFMALLEIAKKLRVQNPDVFINVTAGTWASPFWLNHIDSTWRVNSNDVGWAGKGDDREKWLTFRDGYCHKRFAEASPLYPLNSVMHHGIVHGRAFQGDKVGKSGTNLKNEARSYFANGAMLQELYLTPSMMTADAWDCVADAAKWAHANADVLRDAHWVGGDPLKLEPYGYAAWSPRKGTLMLRNPDDQPRAINLDAAVVFDLPAGAAQSYALSSPYPDQRIRTLEFAAGVTNSVTLEPYEVLVFDAQPKR